MVVDFSNIDYENKPLLILENLDGTAIQTLGYAFNVKVEFNFNEVSTLSFDLPEMVNGVKTPLYDEVVGMRVINLMNPGGGKTRELGRFLLIDPQTTTDGISTIKSCQAYSLEYELAKKTITISCEEDGPCKFYDIGVPANTFVRRIEERTEWRFDTGTIDTEVSERYRKIDVSNEKIYDVLKEAQELYGCIFDFDTYHRLIKVIPTEVSNIDAILDRGLEPKSPITPIYLSPERLIKEIDIEENSDEIITCLDVNGAEGVDIREVEPTGTNKIYNLDYFMTQENFSQELINKWRAWEKACEQYQDLYAVRALEKSQLGDMVRDAQAKLVAAQGQKSILENQLAAYERDYAANKKLTEQESKDLLNDKNLNFDDGTVYYSKGLSSLIDEIKQQIQEVEDSIKTLEKTVEENEQKFEDYDKYIHMISESLQWKEFFTEDEIEILNRYVFEEFLEDSSFTNSEAGSYTNTATVGLTNSTKINIAVDSISQVSDVVTSDIVNMAGQITKDTLDKLNQEFSKEYEDQGYADKLLAEMNSSAFIAFDGGSLTTVISYEEEPSEFHVSSNLEIDDLVEQYEAAFKKRPVKKNVTENNITVDANGFVGNVDINNRPIVVGAEQEENGEDTYSTSLTFIQEHKKSDNTYYILHFASILQDGTVLNETERNEYLDKLYAQSDPMTYDKSHNKLLYKMDTKFNGQDITDSNLKAAIDDGINWDKAMHTLQDSIYHEAGELAVKIAQAKYGYITDARVQNKIVRAEIIKATLAITSGKITTSKAQLDHDEDYYRSLFPKFEKYMSKWINSDGTINEDALSQSIDNFSNDSEAEAQAAELAKYLSSSCFTVSADEDTDATFTFTAYLGQGSISNGGVDEDAVEFNTGNITLQGKVDGDFTWAVTKTLVLPVKDMTHHFTKDSTDYETRSVAEDLYDYGKQVLFEKASPLYTFSVSAANFLAASEFKSFKDALALGDRVYLRLDQGPPLTPYVTKVSIDYEDPTSFAIEFSNTYTAFDSQFRLAKLLEQSVSMGKKLDIKDGVYDQFVNSGANNKVKEFLDSALDVAKNTVMSSRNQAIEFGDAGIRVRKWADDTHQTYDPHEIWIVDNMITFTNDSWDSACMAIGEIFDDSFGGYQKVPSNATYDSNKLYYEKVATNDTNYEKGEDGTYYKYKPSSVTQDSWDSKKGSLYYRTGGYQYGVAAPYLVGSIIAGENLFISTDDGYFRVDDNGVYIYNEALTIAGPNDEGLTFTAHDGLIHRIKYNGRTYEAGFSAQPSANSGHPSLYLKIGEGDGDDGDDYKLSCDIMPDKYNAGKDAAYLIIDGYITARDLFLGKNGESVLTFINTSGTKKGDDDSSTYRENDNTLALAGKYLSCAGLYISGGAGSFEVTEDGNVIMEDSSITLSNSSGYTIYIDPDNGIKFTHDKDIMMHLDIKNGDALFKGTVTASKIDSTDIRGGTLALDSGILTGSKFVMLDPSISENTKEELQSLYETYILKQMYDWPDKAQKGALLYITGEGINSGDLNGNGVSNIAVIQTCGGRELTLRSSSKITLEGGQKGGANGSITYTTISADTDGIHLDGTNIYFDGTLQIPYADDVTGETTNQTIIKIIKKEVDKSVASHLSGIQSQIDDLKSHLGAK